MAKQYFQHDFAARTSFQIQALIREFGAEGYGIFWAIVEVLHEKKNRMPIKPYMFLGISDQLRINPEKIEKVVKFCINECDLFLEKKGFLSSNRVRRNIIKQLAISKVRSNASKQRTNHQQTSALKEKKEKEIKEEEAPSTTNLYESLPSGDKKLFEMFRNCLDPKQHSDRLIITEVGKFKNKYPDVANSRAGPLINTWCANLNTSRKQQIVV